MMDDNGYDPCILLFRGRGLISWAIRFQTRGQYSHAAIRLRDGRIVEAWQGAGVRVKTLTDWDGVEAFGVQGMTGDMWDDAIDFALSQVGKGYDYRNVWRFVSRRPAAINNKWFCSELVCESLRQVSCGIVRCPTPEIFPSMIGWSPLVFPLGKAGDP